MSASLGRLPRSASRPGTLVAAGIAGPIACVWDLSVVAHERTAWISHLLAAEVPDLGGYLGDVLTGHV